MLHEGSVSCASAGWLPCVLSVLLAAGMVQAYVWAVCRQDVKPWMPFISAAGGNPPQSGLFAIFLFLTAFFGLLTTLARHAVLHQEVFRMGSTGLRLLNHAALGLGFLCLAGMLLVAAYPVHSWKVASPGHTATEEEYSQWRSSVLLPHTAGAALCLASGFLYCMVQAVLSLRLRPAMSPAFLRGRHPHLFAARTALCLAALAALISMCVGRTDSPDPWKNTKGTEGRALAEWILALLLALLFLSLYPEMRAVRLEVIARVDHGAAGGSSVTFAEEHHATAIM